MDNTQTIKEITDRHSFLGLVTRKDYEKLLCLQLQTIECSRKLLDEGKSEKIFRQWTEELLDKSQIELKKYIMLNDVYQYLYANGEDINYADFIMCITQQQDDSELLNNMIEISKELRG